MLSAMVRPEDTIRVPRSYHGSSEEDVGGKKRPDSGISPRSSYNPENPPREEAEEVEKEGEGAASQPNEFSGDRRSSAVSKAPSGTKLLSQEETTEIARHAVENGIQETKRSLAGNEVVSDVVKPKLTIDLGHSNIVRIPEPVVDIIKDEVERLSLSNNHIYHIPYRFAECSHLRYLNIRANNFREFPKGVYKLPLLEILDISRNKINHLPEEIRRLTSLRVLSVMQNRLDELPSGLSDMSKLQILKVAGNPLQTPLRKALEESESAITNPSMSDNEREVAVTGRLKRYLKTRLSDTSPEHEGNGEPSDGALETPKPVKRGMKSRFPVIPSTGDGSSGSRSPSLSRPPPIPIRSHYRIASGQTPGYYSGTLQRPGITPLNGGSERNRSNSEGIIQASLAARSKRMGVVNRKNTDLGTVDETRSYRNSHFRGLSHGSVLRTRPIPAPGGSNTSSPSSPRDRRRLRDGFVNRMSSLPEHKGERQAAEPIVEGAKGILFALFQTQSHVSALINVIKREDARRNSLEIVFYNASTHVERLNEALEGAENLEDGDHARLSGEAIKRECDTCIMAYSHVAIQLRNSLDKIISNGDARYVRSLMLMIYGSICELRNACVSLGVPMGTRERYGSSGKSSAPETRKTSAGSERFIGPAITPTREPVPAMRRFRSDTTVQRSQMPTHGPFPAGGNFQSAVSSPGFGPAPFASRSRSGSRSNFINTSVPTSLATPRSGESFPSIPSSVVPRINPLTGLDEIEEERIFEKIFYQLTAAYSAALQAVPLARRQFARCLELTEPGRQAELIRGLWNNLLRRCRLCLEASEALGMRLSNMKVKEPGGGMRNQREFWQLCKTFMQSFVDLVTDMREIRSMQLLPPDIIIILRPVQRASREAGRLIEASPWSFLADMSSSNAGNLYGPPLQTPQNQSSNTSLSPQSVALPATPLSAALGPAAQATVPSTPASAYSDKFFEGDVFQRADSLLSMPSQGPFFNHRR